MISPVPDNARSPATDSTSIAERRHKLARKWAYLVSLTAYLPQPHGEIERDLLDLVERLFDAMTSEPMPTHRVAEVGARLVDLHCVGKASLPCTVDVLAGALLAEPELRRFDRLPERVAHLLGALASGYVEAVRSSTLEQQDNLHRALLEAMWVSERKLRTSTSWLDEVLARLPNGIAITDLDGRFMRVNPALDRILDRSVAESPSATLFDLMRTPGGLDLRKAYRELRDGGVDRLELRPELRSANGTPRPVTLSASVLRDPDDRASNYVTIVVEDTELAVLRSQLNHQALHDMITGLPNRQHFTNRLRQVLHEATATTLYALELDGLAALTDGLGRQVADALMLAVAERLAAAVAETEGAMIARFEGGMFAMLVESSPTAPDTVTVIKNINRALADPVRVAELRVPMSVSIGVVHQPSRDADPPELIHAAELALGRAKSKGRGQWALFDPDRDARDRDSLALIAGLPGAWDNGQLRVVYRPVVRLADEHVLAIEALFRWDHPEIGPISHHRCLELAEHTGLILSLGNRLLRKACEQLRRQRDVPLHISLTAHQSTDRDLVDRVMRALDDTGVPPTRLQLAMPAASLRCDHGAVDNLNGLAGAGVPIAMHRVTGALDELTCLEDLPIGAVHLAPSLVRRQPTASVAGRAVAQLITLVHAAVATVTVNDLKTRAQARSWHQYGADCATGPIFTRAT